MCIKLQKFVLSNLDNSLVWFNLDKSFVLSKLNRLFVLIKSMLKG